MKFNSYIINAMNEGAKKSSKRDIYKNIVSKIKEFLEKNPSYHLSSDPKETLSDLNETGVFYIPESAPGFACVDVNNVTEEEADTFFDILLDVYGLAEILTKTEVVNESMSVIDKLEAAYPGVFDFSDSKEVPLTEAADAEDSDIVKALIDTYGEEMAELFNTSLKDDTDVKNGVSEGATQELELVKESIIDKLAAAYPELNLMEQPNDDEILTESAEESDIVLALIDTYGEEMAELFNSTKENDAADKTSTEKDDSLVNEDVEGDIEIEYIDADDDYFDLDDVEQDRVHAALYGGDRMYCDCGAKLVMDEWGGYCPECDPKRLYDDYN